MTTMTIVLTVAHLLVLAAAGVVLFRALHARPTQWIAAFEFSEVPLGRRGCNAKPPEDSARRRARSCSGRATASTAPPTARIPEASMPVAWGGAGAGPGRGRGRAGAPLSRARGTLLLPAFPAA